MKKYMPATTLAALFLCLLYLSSFHFIPQSSSYMETKKEFSFIVRVPVNYSPDQVAQAGVKWNQLLEQWKKDSTYIISFPFPGEGYVVSGKDKQVKNESVVSDGLRVVSAIFLRANDMQSAIELAKTFPVLEYGGSVEVREIPNRNNNAVKNGK